MSQFTNRQNEIIQASIKLISDRGIQNFTTKTLASIIGVSEPAIYRHFSGKRQILLSILLKIKESSGVLPQEESDLNQIKKLFLVQTNHFIENPALAAIIFSEEIFQNDEELSNLVISMMDKRHSIILNILTKEQKKGNIRSDISPHQLTTIIMGTLRLIISRWKLSGFGFDLKKEIKDSWESLETILNV